MHLSFSNIKIPLFQNIPNLYIYFQLWEFPFPYVEEVLNYLNGPFITRPMSSLVNEIPWWGCLVSARHPDNSVSMILSFESNQSQLSPPTVLICPFRRSIKGKACWCHHKWCALGLSIILVPELLMWLLRGIHSRVLPYPFLPFLPCIILLPAVQLWISPRDIYCK